MELELRLTEVKENLKKSLAGGALGPPTDSRNSIKVSHWDQTGSVVCVATLSDNIDGG